MATRAMRAPVAAGVTLVALLLALALILIGTVGGDGHGGPAVAAAKGCRGVNGEIKVVSKYPKPFASQYTKKLRVQIFNRARNVKKWHVELYTYSGFRLGRSKQGKWLNYGDKAAIKLKQSMQPGPYTVVLKGEVRGCGQSEFSDSVKLRNCLGKLPIKFFNKPKGLAEDYNRGGYVSVGIEPRSSWAPIKKVKSTLVDFDGVVYGTAELPKGSRKLIGQQYLNHELTRNLKAGSYSVYVQGKAPQPRSCGDNTKTAVLTFK